MISNIGGYPHLDDDACTRRGVLVSSYMMPGRPSYATAELNWGLIIAAMRHLPQEMAALHAGRWRTATVRSDSAEKRWASTATEKSARWSPATARRSR